MRIWLDESAQKWPQDSTEPGVGFFQPPAFEDCWRSERIEKGDGRFTRFWRVKSPFVDNKWLPDIAFRGQVELKEQKKDDDGRLWIRSLIHTPDIDSTNERLAWDFFLESMPLFMERPRMLAYHDLKQPVGNWPAFQISEAGTLLTGFVSKARPDIQDLVRDDVLDSSVGFLMQEAIWNEELEILEGIKGRLFEGSLVPIPANESVWVEVLSGFKQYAPTEALNTKDSVIEPEETPAPEMEREIPAPCLPDTSGLVRCVRRIASVTEAVTSEVATIASEVLADG